ncbi:MAG: hypothetical protein PHQ03_12125 [Methylococcales bacterium]|nr:hypothetical protein [Methylococcales bacterium]
MKKLTHDNSTANLSAPRNIEVGICNPRSNGDNTPHNLAVFLRLSFCNPFIFEQIIFIMVVLLEQSLWLVAPLRDIANSFNTTAQCFATLFGGFTTLSNGIHQ